MSIESLLRLVVTTLGDLEIPYMLTGSLASSFHGVPRATRDIDLVVDAEAVKLNQLGRRLRDAGLYVSEAAIAEAVDTRGMFNAVDGPSGAKIDFVLRKDRRFSREEFDSRTSESVVGLSLNIVRAEDIVVAKLEWARLGESERQLRDVAGIVAVQGDRLDRSRVLRWVSELGLEVQWQAALELLSENPE